MIAKVFIALIMAAVIVAGIGVYLSPDDLVDCTAGPDAQKSACAPSDAIVVVSGGDTSARTDEAIRLFNDGWAPIIVFSGAAADKRGPSNAAVMRDQAIASGVPAEATIVEDISETTRQNAKQVKLHLAENDIGDVILVTSGYHMRRAGLEFIKELGGDITLRRHPVSTDSQWSALWWLTPWGWGLALGELVRIAVFYIGGSR